MPLVLIADDDPAIVTVLTQAMEEDGYDVRTTGNGAELLSWIRNGLGDLVITDVLMPGMNGLEVLSQLRQERFDLPVLVISAQNTLMTAVEANKRGATEYLPKPFDLNELLSVVRKHVQVKSVIRSSQESPSDSEAILMGRSSAMQEIYRAIARLVNVDLTVLIEGESGTGKERVAEALHRLGKKKNMPFVAVNMAAIPRELIESELFGHEKGAFTGATARKPGKFEQAEGGMLFLDEIGDMPMEAQTRLLRVLQQGEYTPIGSNRIIKTNVRIVCATHRNLAELVARGDFREDLFYRINVVPLTLPPLRERTDDIPELVMHFLRKAEARALPRKRVAPEALVILREYAWPGNVRELENLIYRLAATRSEPEISAEIIQQELRAKNVNHTQREHSDPQSLQELVTPYLPQYFQNHLPGLPPVGVYDRIIGLVEQALFDVTLKATKNNQIRASQILGINRNTLRKKLQERKN